MHVCFALMIGVTLARLSKHRGDAIAWAPVPAARDLRDRRHRQPLPRRRDARRRHRRPLRLGAASWLAPRAPDRLGLQPAQGLMATPGAARPGHGAGSRGVRRERDAQPAHRVAPDAERDLAHRLRRSTSSPPCSSGRSSSSWRGIAFIVGSVCDTLDGRYSRMSGKGTPFGAFLDSTLDRIEEGIVLTAVAAYFAKRRQRVRRRGASCSPCSPRSWSATPAPAPRRSASSARSASPAARCAS